MKKQFNWGIIGLGTVAHEWAQNFQNNDQQILYAAASRNQTKAQNFCDQYNIPHAYNYEEILNDTNVDIVYIATPHNLHYEQIKQSLNANKHVFCEKAITLNSQELLDVKKLAEEKELVLLEGTTLFYMPLSHKIKEIITCQKYGPLKMMQVNFGSYKPYDPQNRFFNPNLAGGALLDIGVYALAACAYYMSEIPQVISTTMVPAPTNVDEMSTILLRNQANELATVNLTFRAKMPKRCLIALEEGYFEIYNYPRAQEATFTTHDGQITNIQVGNTSEAFPYEQQTMIDLITSKKHNHYLDLSVAVMQMMDTCREMWQQND